RLAATYLALAGEEAPIAGRLAGEAYAGPEAFKSDLETVLAALLETEGELFSMGPLPDLIRAVEVFGFHLASLDLRQNSAVHARVVGELLKGGGVLEDYEKLEEEKRCALLLSELGHNRLLSSPFASYSEEARRELETLGAAADVIRRYGPKTIFSYIVSNST